MEGENILLLLGVGLVAYFVYQNYVGTPPSGDGGDGGGPGNDPTGIAALAADTGNTGGAAGPQPLSALPGVTNVQMQPTDIYAAAQQAIALGAYSDVTPEMLTTVAMIESSGNTAASRYEPALNDSSYGLCQVLLSTADWLYNDMGATAVGQPTAATLADPGNCLYFGAAYLHYLRNYRNTIRSDEFVIRGYNGGPNGINEAATAPYWAKFTAEYSSLGFD